jgi:hypothetical protein
MRGRARKSRLVAFVADEELAAFLASLPNRSQYIRRALLTELHRLCPACGGTGYLPPGLAHALTDRRRRRGRMTMLDLIREAARTGDIERLASALILTGPVVTERVTYTGRIRGDGAAEVTLLSRVVPGLPQAKETTVPVAAG